MVWTFKEKKAKFQLVWCKPEWENTQIRVKDVQFLTFTSHFLWQDSRHAVKKKRKKKGGDLFNKYNNPDMERNRKKKYTSAIKRLD